MKSKKRPGRKCLRTGDKAPSTHQASEKDQASNPEGLTGYVLIPVQPDDELDEQGRRRRWVRDGRGAE
jgi:hypothetical protein